jgi:HD-like signal output (HDOD) protein
MRVGIRQIREMILMTTVKATFDSVPPSQIDMDSFWRHSIAVGMMAKNLPKAIRMPQPEKMYVLGLLHDLGRLVLFVKMGEEVADLMLRRAKETLSLHHLEK